MSKTILVLGSTGKTGKRVAERLQKMNQSMRLGSRKGNPAFDWEDQSTWAGVLKDVAKVYITFQPDIAMPGAVETVQAFVDKAKEAGIQKLVFLSGRGEKESEQCEQIVMSSGIDWTIARASWFCQNFSEGYLLDSILAGHVALPTMGVMEPLIDVDDIADVVTAALTTNNHSNKLYELTGPRLLTFEDAVHEISAGAKFPIQYHDISISEYTAMLREYNTPPEIISLLEYLFTQTMDGRNANVSDGVQRALGRKPTDFSEYVKRTVATGVWQRTGLPADRLVS
jgi:uncharacterized protein YbjT (DUF2867 family)